MLAKATLASFLAALLLAGRGLSQEEGEGAAKAPDPQITKDVKEFKDVISDRKMSRDAEAMTLLGKWVQDFDNLHDRNKKEIVEVLDALFRKVKQRPPEQQQLYEAAAVALGRMGSEGAKALKAAFTNARYRKSEWVALRARLVLSIGQTKDDRMVDFVLDTALADPEDQIMARAGEALGFYDALPIKERREVVKKLIKRFNEIHDASRTDALNDPVAETRKRTYAAIADPWNTTLGKLTKQTFRTPQEWQHWWNKNKNEDWEEAKGS